MIILLLENDKYVEIIDCKYVTDMYTYHTYEPNCA